jgi:hypothetical protein
MCFDNGWQQHCRIIGNNDQKVGIAAGCTCFQTDFHRAHRNAVGNELALLDRRSDNTDAELRIPARDAARRRVSAFRCKLLNESLCLIDAGAGFVGQAQLSRAVTAPDLGPGGLKGAKAAEALRFAAPRIEKGKSGLTVLSACEGPVVAKA